MLMEPNSVKGFSATVSDGRFELGIGSGLPTVRAYAKELGLADTPDAAPYGDIDERLSRMKETVAHLRELDAGRHTPVVVAAGGPKSLATAAGIADVITFPPAALRTWEASLRTAETLAKIAGSRLESIERGSSLFVVGDDIPAWTQHFIGADPAADSPNMLRGSTAEMADELRRRRGALGVSHISVHEAFMEELAPVVNRLRGN
jgi:alkanesulfonate monooxygenase SsuD/methylene tetrahydromethanopterin reductase-like flavin-dependent oxidoreductase (luciferase family)